MIQLSQFLARLKNAIVKKKVKLIVPLNKNILNILWIFYKEGFICGYQIKQKGIEVQLKYIKERCNIAELKQISSISRRVYCKKKNLKKDVKLGEFAIISTSKGFTLVTKKIGEQSKIYGGEYLFKIN